LGVNAVREKTPLTAPNPLGQRIRRGWALLLIGLLAAGTAVPCHGQSPSAEAASKSCLWAVESGANRVFLLGSFHFLRPDDYPLPPAIDAAYAGSRTVVFETDIARMQDPRVQARMLELGAMPQGQDVFATLTADTRRKLEHRLAYAGLPTEVMAGMKPWLIALTLSSLEFMRLGFDPNLGVDMHFYQRARKDGKRTGELETVEQQLQILAGMDAWTQDIFLSQTLQELEDVPGMVSDMLGFWLTGQADALRRLLFKSIEQYPDLLERMLTRRNQAWIEKIEDLIRLDEAALVIVGAMHLVGPGSVVDLLQKKGYRVEQR
jgi:uncharacterized protein YbaP (TraB family)